MEQHPNSRANLKPHNSRTAAAAGRKTKGKKKAPSIIEAVRKYLEDPRSKFRSEKFAQAMLKHAMKGNSKIIDQVLDRIEGKLPTMIQGSVTADINLEIKKPPMPGTVTPGINNINPPDNKNTPTNAPEPDDVDLDNIPDSGVLYPKRKKIKQTRPKRNNPERE